MTDLTESVPDYGAPAPFEVDGARRPSAAELQEVLRRVAEDAISVRKICRRMGLDNGSVFKAFRDDPVLRQQYADAREARGESMGERVVDIVDDMLDRKITPEQARVAVDGYKWTAGQMSPKGWGKRTIQAEISGPDGEPIPVEANLTVTRVEYAIIDPAEGRPRLPTSPPASEV